MLLHERFLARRELEGQGTSGGAVQMLTFRARAVVPANVLVRFLDRESVLLNVETERYFGLDETATRMWQLVTASQDIEIAYQELLAEFDVEPELLRTNLTDLLGQLVENGLLQVLPADVGKTAAL
jgi:coenzyme PQQ synthesis protein D (PqqD)